MRAYSADPRAPRLVLAPGDPRAHIAGMTAPSIAALTDRALVRVSGPDARPFLHNLLTQDVETLAAGALRYGALLTPQGRLLHEVFLLGQADAVVLDAPAADGDALVQRLTLYRLRAKVTIAPWEGRVSAAWGGSNPDALPGMAWARDPRLVELGLRGYGEPSAESGPDLEAANAYNAHRLSLGVADPERDLRDDKTYPIEANFDLLNGIDFKKGCFIGQETTSRMKRRGAIKTRMVPLVFDGASPPYGAEVLAGSLRAGEVRSGLDGRALALVRLDRAALGGLTVEGRPVRLDPPAWLANALEPAEPAETTAVLQDS